MPQYQDRGVVLKVRAYREADSLVRIFCQEQGMVDAVARGARRPTSRLLAAVQPLAYAYFRLYRGRGGLDTLQSAELETGWSRLGQDLERLGWGFALAGIIEALFSLHDPHPAAFKVLVGALSALNEGKDAPSVGLQAAFQLLAVAGFGIDPDQCGHCQGPLAPPVGLDLWEGSLVCESCRRQLGEQAARLGAGLYWTLRQWLHGEEDQFGRVRAQGTVRQEAQFVLRQSLAIHGGRLPKAFDFLQEVSALEMASWKGGRRPPAAAEGASPVEENEGKTAE